MLPAWSAHPLSLPSQRQATLGYPGIRNYNPQGVYQSSPAQIWLAQSPYQTEVAIPRVVHPVAPSFASIGCRGAPLPHPSNRTRRDAVATSPVVSGAPRGIEQVVAPGAIVLLGEVHGTAEIPAAISRILRYVVAQGHSVCLGLEMWEPPGQQGTLNTYICSAGTSADRKALFQLPHWDIQDGRQSEAYFTLIEQARLLRQSGAHLEAFGFDAVVNDQRGSTLQSKAMASNVLAKIAAMPNDTIFILMAGNGHCCTVPCGREPMGFFVKQFHPRMRALDVRCAHGSKWWGVAPEGPLGEMTIGVHMWAGDGAAHLDPFVDLSVSARRPGFDGVLDMGVLTPSLPMPISS